MAKNNNKKSSVKSIGGRGGDGDDHSLIPMVSGLKPVTINENEADVIFDLPFGTFKQAAVKISTYIHNESRRITQLTIDQIEARIKQSNSDSEKSDYIRNRLGKVKQRYKDIEGNRDEYVVKSAFSKGYTIAKDKPIWNLNELKEFNYGTDKANAYLHSYARSMIAGFVNYKEEHYLLDHLGLKNDTASSLKGNKEVSDLTFSKYINPGADKEKLLKYLRSRLTPNKHQINVFTIYAFHLSNYITINIFDDIKRLALILNNELRLNYDENRLESLRKGMHVVIKKAEIRPKEPNKEPKKMYKKKIEVISAQLINDFPAIN